MGILRQFKGRRARVDNMSADAIEDRAVFCEQNRGPILLHNNLQERADSVPLEAREAI